MRHRTIIFLLAVFVLFVLIVPTSGKVQRRRRSTLKKSPGRLGPQELIRKRHTHLHRDGNEGTNDGEDPLGDVVPGGESLVRRRRRRRKRSSSDTLKRRKRRKRKKRVEEEKKDDDFSNDNRIRHMKRMKRRTEVRRLKTEKREKNPLRKMREDKVLDDDDKRSSEQGTSGGIVVLYVLCGVLAVLVVCCFILISFSLLWWCCKELRKGRKKYVHGKSGYMGARDKVSTEKKIGRKRKNEIMNNIRADTADYHQLEDAV